MCFQLFMGKGNHYIYDSQPVVYKVYHQFNLYVLERHIAINMQ